MIKVLILAANPVDTTWLQVRREFDKIETQLRKAGVDQHLDFRIQAPTRVSDLQWLLRDHQPHIVHFSGHGTNANEIILEDENGKAQVVPAEALTKLFMRLNRQLNGNIRCIVLNTCFSDYQAETLSRSVPYVIGMTDEISDPAAIVFSYAFYQALGFRASFPDAFESGRDEIHLNNIYEYEKPILHTQRRRHYPLLSELYVDSQFGEPYAVSSVAANSAGVKLENKAQRQQKAVSKADRNRKNNIDILEKLNLNPKNLARLLSSIDELDPPISVE